MKHILVFGFEPFGEEPINPSGEAARALDGKSVSGATIHGVVLPVTYGGAFPALKEHLRKWEPDAVLGVGQGKVGFHVEWWAHNVVGVRQDNDGRTQGRTTVDPRGEERLAVTLDAEAVFAAVKRVVGDKAPVAMSDSAGDYLCNHTLYKLLQWAGEDVPAGFFHVPRLFECPQPVITAAVEAALSVLLPVEDVA